MKVWDGVPVRHLATLAFAMTSVVCILTLVSPRCAVAKVRPPIEMGDPDGTGDQKPGSGPAGSATTTKYADGGIAQSRAWVDKRVFGATIMRGPSSYAYVFWLIFNRYQL